MAAAAHLVSEENPKEKAIAFKAYLGGLLSKIDINLEELCEKLNEIEDFCKEGAEKEHARISYNVGVLKELLILYKQFIEIDLKNMILFAYLSDAINAHLIFPDACTEALSSKFLDDLMEVFLSYMSPIDWPDFSSRFSIFANLIQYDKAKWVAYMFEYQNGMFAETFLVEIVNHLLVKNAKALAKSRECLSKIPQIKRKLICIIKDYVATEPSDIIAWKRWLTIESESIENQIEHSLAEKSIQQRLGEIKPSLYEQIGMQYACLYEITQKPEYLAQAADNLLAAKKIGSVSADELLKTLNISPVETVETYAYSVQSAHLFLAVPHGAVNSASASFPIERPGTPMPIGDAAEALLTIAGPPASKRRRLNGADEFLGLD